MGLTTTSILQQPDNVEAPPRVSTTFRYVAAKGAASDSIQSPSESGLIDQRRNRRPGPWRDLPGHCRRDRSGSHGPILRRRKKGHSFEMRKGEQSGIFSEQESRRVIHNSLYR